MSEMVERVARAILRAELLNKFTMDDVVAKRIDDEWPQWTDNARAAIQAMREPTDDIVKAHHLVPDDNDFDERAARNWRNLIDAALGKVDA